jgi:hypothetical protein
MRMTRNWIGSGLGLVCLVLAGCSEQAPEPSALGEELTRQMHLTAPTVGGPSEELTVAQKPAEITAAVEAALKASGVSLVQQSISDAGQWLFGKSLADRGVLVEVRPIYPGRSTLKVTVEGGDALARELLVHLTTEIRKRMR